MVGSNSLLQLGKELKPYLIGGAAGVAIGATGGALAGAAIAKSRSRKKRKRKSSSTRKRSSSSRKNSVRRTPRTAGKRKDRSTKRIRMTKNGQPYVIMASGKARFISKRSAKASRKRKGGRY
jgi:hypothetical protein